MGGLPDLKENFELTYPTSLRDKWNDPKLGTKLVLKYFLAYQWRLFDLGNLINALGQHSNRYHFVEWWTAIQLYKKYGLLSLVGKYVGRFPNADEKLHYWKIERFKEVIPDTLTQKFLKGERNNRLKLPDLLIYPADKSDYAFVEVKGPGDRLSDEQKTSFEKIKQRLKKNVHIAWLKTDSARDKLRIS